jgi:hypothetical protein
VNPVRLSLEGPFLKYTIKQDDREIGVIFKQRRYRIYLHQTGDDDRILQQIVFALNYAVQRLRCGSNLNVNYFVE